MKFRRIMAFTMAASLMISGVPAGFTATDAVWGSEKAAADVHSDSSDDVGGPNQYLSTKDRKMALKKVGDLPTKYDLREEGYVTPVKSQGHFGTCWSFGGTAAAEISILSELGTSYEDYVFKGAEEDLKMDLSEKQTAYFMYRAVTPELNVSQAGEGKIREEVRDENGQINYGALFGGGLPACMTSLYSRGTGPVFEYDGKSAGYPFRYVNKENQFLEDERGFVYPDTGGDWSIDEKYGIISSFELEDGNLLPDPAGDDVITLGTYNYDESATAAIKRELYKGRGVSIAFHAGRALAGQEENLDYLNEKNYAVYTFETSDDFCHRVLNKGYSELTSDELTQYADDMPRPNHAVCIVGWDDNYSKDNFVVSPEKDGAWIVKNSWGSETDAEPGNPNYVPWGTPDENGKHTGYFYLSYYDKSLIMPESFNFNLERGDDNGGRYVMQYDFLRKSAAESAFGLALTETPVMMANVFDFRDDDSSDAMALYALGTETTYPNSRVRMHIYELNDNFKDPTDGILLGSKDESFEYAGFHRIRLNGKYTLRGGKAYSVVCTEQVNTDDGYRYILPVGFGHTKDLADLRGENEYSVAVVNKGESYLNAGDDDGWTDWAESKTQFEDKYLNEFRSIYNCPDLKSAITFDNFPIKAYAEPIDEKPDVISVKYVDGTNILSTVYYDKDSAVGTLPVPDTKTGYVFDGWYTQESGGDKITSAYKVSEEQTLYAHWSKDETSKNDKPPVISVKFVDGKNTLSSVYYDKDSAIGALPVPDAKSGYIFEGWYTQSSKGVKISSTYKVNVNQTLYAHWNKMKVKATTIKKIQAGKKQLVVTIKKVSGAAGYEIRYSTKASMKSAKKISVTSLKSTIKKLKAKKKYYLRAYAYKLDSTGARVYSKASAIKNKKTK